MRRDIGTTIGVMALSVPVLYLLGAVGVALVLWNPVVAQNDPRVMWVTIAEVMALGAIIGACRRRMLCPMTTAVLISGVVFMAGPVAVVGWVLWGIMIAFFIGFACLLS